jgi:hypothetical protein
MAAGFGDWLCHRAQKIERSAGVRKSLLHWLMLGELGLAITAALLLEITAAVLVLLAAACVAHELTTWADLRYAASQRRIAVPEQWVHGVQMALPWAGLVALALIHRHQALALLGWGTPDWGWRWKDPPLPPAWLAAVGAGAALFVLLPFAEELRRCRRASARAGRQPHPRAGGQQG